MRVQYLVTIIFLGKRCGEKSLISCADQTQCIHHDYLCNGYAECNDGSDERCGMYKLSVVCN